MFVHVIHMAFRGAWGHALLNLDSLRLPLEHSQARYLRMAMHKVITVPDTFSGTVLSYCT